MQQSINRVRRLFTITIVGLCVASMVSLLAVLYITSSIGFSDRTSPGDLAALTEGYPAVANYLQEQKQSEAHFVTLANLIKSDQQQLLGRTALMVAVPLLLASAVLGYLLARFLLLPVAEAYASQERFLQDAAHELRNPLATMSAVIQQARQTPSTTGKNKASPIDTDAQLAVLERQTNHMVRINEDLLFLERKKQRTVNAIDVAELLQDVVDTMRPLANQSQVKVTVKALSAKLAIDPDDFISMSRNLLENAIKYSKDGTPGKVVASLEDTPRTLTLRVKDFGVGIPQDEIAHIGKRFYRAANVARREGTGLGFAIVCKIARDYNADVHIASNVGKGTIVSVTFKH